MESFLPQVETILDKRAKHAVLLVAAIEERTNMTTLVEGIPGKLHGLRGGHRVLTFAPGAVTQSTFAHPAVDG
jgi:hypothetical protein